MIRRYYLDGRELPAGRAFEASGLSHPANWKDVYSADDLSRFGITFEDVEEPKPEPPAFHRVSTYRIVKRLEDAGKIEAANAALEANLSARGRFYTAGSIRSDDADAIAILKAIGADPAVILAVE